MGRGRISGIGNSARVGAPHRVRRRPGLERAAGRRVGERGMGRASGGVDSEGLWAINSRYAMAVGLCSDEVDKYS